MLPANSWCSINNTYLHFMTNFTKYQEYLLKSPSNVACVVLTWSKTADTRRTVEEMFGQIIHKNTIFIQYRTQYRIIQQNENSNDELDKNAPNP